ncbi:MAG: hypothetical protein Q7S33_00490 [Nanoarchaeota archaeon]|nr:hypothetical protein [Nanoarchaeota archaeon]
MDNALYERPSKENVSVRDVLVQKMEGQARYLNVIDKTDKSIIALSQDQNFRCLYPFQHLNQAIIVKEDDSILVGEAVDKTLLEEVVKRVEVSHLIKRAHYEIDLIQQENLTGYPY